MESQLAWVPNNMGRFIEVDKRVSQSDQAKFMPIIVDLLVDKPLRRGGNVVGMVRNFGFISNTRGFRRSVSFVERWVMMISIVKLSQIDRRPQLNIETSKSVQYSKGGNSKLRNFSNSSHNTRGAGKVSEKGQTFENML